MTCSQSHIISIETPTIIVWPTTQGLLLATVIHILYRVLCVCVCVCVWEREFCSERLWCSCETLSRDFVWFYSWQTEHDLAGIDGFKLSTVLSLVCMYFCMYMCVCVCARIGVVSSVCLWCLELCTNNACFVEVVVSSREAVTSWASRVTLCYYTHTHSHAHMHARAHIQSYIVPFWPPRAPQDTPFHNVPRQRQVLNLDYSGDVFESVCVFVCVCVRDSGGAFWRSRLYGFVKADKHTNALPFPIPCWVRHCWKTKYD